MTTIQEKSVLCSNCNTRSTHSILGSTNEFGYADLDLRPPRMLRDTMDMWLQECPTCGFVAPDLQEEVVDARDELHSEAYLSARADGSLPELARRFFCRALLVAGRQEPEMAFSNMLHASWVADDRAMPDAARMCRLKAVEYLDTVHELSAPQKLQLLDVLRRALSWDRADELADRLTRDGLDDRLGRIAAFQATLIARRDPGPYNLGDIFSPTVKPPSTQKPREPQPHTSFLGRVLRGMGLQR